MNFIQTEFLWFFAIVVTLYWVIGKRAWQNALGPDGPHLRVAKDANDLPVLLGNDLPLRRYGPPIVDMATLAAAIHLTNADILWAESDGLVLSNATETDPSPLEQVFRVGSNGTIQVEADPPRPQPTRGTPRAWATSKS